MKNIINLNYMHYIIKSKYNNLLDINHNQLNIIYIHLLQLLNIYINPLINYL